MEESESLSCWENRDPDNPSPQTRTYKHPGRRRHSNCCVVSLFFFTDPTKWWKKSTGSKCLQSTERRSPWWEMVVVVGKTKTRRMFIFVIYLNDWKQHFLRGAFSWLYRDRSVREIRSCENRESCGTHCSCGDGCSLIKKRWTADGWMGEYSFMFK